MTSALKTTAIALAVASTAILSLRGAVAFYKQYGPGAAENLSQIAQPSQPGTGLGAGGLVTKTQRLQRASSLLAGMGKQGRVSEVFSAQDGSTGVVIQSGEGAFVGWMVDGVDALFVGAKFDPRGNNLTQEEMLARKLATPSETPPIRVGTAPPAGVGAPGTTGQGQTLGRNVEQALVQAVDQSPGFIEGTSGPIWTAYIDGNCAFCNQLWRTLRGPIGAGQIRVRWAPVAVLGGDSAAKAATLLQSQRPLDVLAGHGLRGTPIPTNSISASAQSQIDTNNAMLRALSGRQSVATPTVVVPRGTGAPEIVRGMPQNLDALLKGTS